MSNINSDNNKIIKIMSKYYDCRHIVNKEINKYIIIFYDYSFNPKIS